MTSLVLLTILIQDTMTAFYIAVFIAILGVITLIPTDIGRKVVRETSTLISRPTSTLAPTAASTIGPAGQANSTTSASPTLQIKPIIRRSEDDD